MLICQSRDRQCEQVALLTWTYEVGMKGRQFDSPSCRREMSRTGSRGFLWEMEVRRIGAAVTPSASTGGRGRSCGVADAPERPHHPSPSRRRRRRLSRPSRSVADLAGLCATEAGYGRPGRLTSITMILIRLRSFLDSNSSKPCASSPGLAGACSSDDRDLTGSRLFCPNHRTR